ncbi:hypothetical protein ACQKOF_19630 [Lysinibacillus sp. NPDC093190]
MKKWVLNFCLIGIVLVSIIGFDSTQAKAAIEPGNEIKFNIKSELFTESDIFNVFQATKKDEVKIYFFDTPN